MEEPKKYSVIIVIIRLEVVTGDIVAQNGLVSVQLLSSLWVCALR